MKKTLHALTLLCTATILLFSCAQGDKKAGHIAVDENTRIVSINGATTEILCQLGLEDKIVGVDVTSTYPASIHAKPKVGHNRDMSAEAIVALKPTLVVGTTEMMKPELQQQLAEANIPVILYNLEHSIEGTKTLVTKLADTLGLGDKAVTINQQIDADVASIVKPATAPKVLFIYARGAGTMMVGGQKNAVNSMIQLAGGQNAVTDFDNYKPLTAESLVTANPDVILMFTSGLQSLGGLDGLEQVQGIAQTNAGKNKKVIEMDGQFLGGFGPRVGKAAAELAQKLSEVSTSVSVDSTTTK